MLPPEEYGLLEEIFVRDEDGNLIRRNNFPINISQSVAETLNTNVSYSFANDWGDFDFNIGVIYILEDYDKAFEDSAQTSTVGTSFGLDEYRALSSLSWRRGPWTSLVEIQHTPGYENLFSINAVSRVKITDIESRTTVDTSLGYAFENGLTLRVGVRNLFDEDFPKGIFGDKPYDSSRVDLRGRVGFIDLTYDFSGF